MQVLFASSICVGYRFLDETAHATELERTRGLLVLKFEKKTTVSIEICSHINELCFYGRSDHGM